MLNNKKILVPLSSGSGLPSGFKYGASLSLNIDEDFVITAELLDQNGDLMGEEQSIDLPIEATVVDGSYDEETNSLVLILHNGNTVPIPLGDLIRGLQSEITSSNELSADLVDDASADNKFVTPVEKSFIEALYTYIDGSVDNIASKADLETKQDLIDGSNEISADFVVSGEINKVFTSEDKAKLDGIESGAEVNAVDSVNNQTGAVLLDADDISDSSTENKFVTEAEKTTWNNKLSSSSLDGTFFAAIFS